MREKDIILSVYVDKFKKDFMNLVKQFNIDTGEQIDHIFLMTGNKDCRIELNQEIFEENRKNDER